MRGCIMKEDTKKKIDVAQIIGEEEITFKNSEFFIEQIKKEAKVPLETLILDLRDIDIIDSVAIGSLFDIKKFLANNKTILIIENLKPHILELFQLLGFDKNLNNSLPKR